LRCENDRELAVWSRLRQAERCRSQKKEKQFSHGIQDSAVQLEGVKKAPPPRVMFSMEGEAQSSRENRFEDIEDDPNGVVVQILHPTEGHLV